MILDGILLDKITSSLKDKLTFSRIQRIRQINNKCFVFEINSIKSSPFSSGILYLSFEGQKSLIVLSADKDIGGESKLKSFGAFLRKHVQSSVIKEIRNYPYERIIEMIIEKRNEIGDIEVKHLIMEFIGARSNLIVCDKNLIILDSLTHYEKKNDKDREIMPARKYYLPDKDLKLSPKSLSTMPSLIFDTFSITMTAKRDNSYTNFNVEETNKTNQLLRKDLYSYLLSTIDGLSKYLLLNILSYTELSPDVNVMDLSLKDKEQICTIVKKVMTELFEQDNSYLIYKNQLLPAINDELTLIANLYNQGKIDEALDRLRTSYYFSEESSLPDQVHLCHNPQYRNEIRFNNICDAFALYLSIKSNVDKLHNIRKVASDLIKKDIKKLEKKLLIHNSEYASCRDLEEDQRKGQLIYANLGSLQNLDRNKTDLLELVDYYSEDLSKVKIKIDSKYSIQENASRFLKQYNKKLTRTKIMREMIQDEQDLLSLAKESLIFISNANSETEIEEISEDFYEFYEKINNKNRQRNNRKNEEELGLANSNTKSRTTSSSNSKQKMQINLASNSGNKRKRLKQALKLQQSKHKQKQKNSDKTAPPLAPMQFLMPNGTIILVGRNAKQNEKLSLRDANKNFVWFHLKNAPGTHVILCKNFEEADKVELETAASLCAFFSSPKEMRNFANKLEIDYCKVSNLKKAKSAKPGMLIYDNFKSIYITTASPTQLNLVKLD